MQFFFIVDSWPWRLFCPRCHNKSWKSRSCAHFVQKLFLHKMIQEDGWSLQYWVSAPWALLISLGLLTLVAIAIARERPGEREKTTISWLLFIFLMNKLNWVYRRTVLWLRKRGPICSFTFFLCDPEMQHVKIAAVIWRLSKAIFQSMSALTLIKTKTSFHQ